MSRKPYGPFETLNLENDLKISTGGLIGCDLHGLSLGHEKISLQDATLKGVRASGKPFTLNLINSKADQCHFENAAILDFIFQNVRVQDTLLYNASFRSGMICDADLERCDLRSMSLNQVTLLKSRLVDCDLSYSVWSNCHISETNLWLNPLSHAVFENCTFLSLENGDALDTDSICFRNCRFVGSFPKGILRQIHFDSIHLENMTESASEIKGLTSCPFPSTPTPIVREVPVASNNRFSGLEIQAPPKGNP